MYNPAQNGLPYWSPTVARHALNDSDHESRAAVSSIDACVRYIASRHCTYLAEDCSSQLSEEEEDVVQSLHLARCPPDSLDLNARVLNADMVKKKMSVSYAVSARRGGG
jgi:hypothetical protein